MVYPQRVVRERHDEVAFAPGFEAHGADLLPGPVHQIEAVRAQVEDEDCPSNVDRGKAVAGGRERDVAEPLGPDRVEVILIRDVPRDHDGAIGRGLRGLDP